MSSTIPANIRITPLKTEREKEQCAKIMEESEPWSKLEFSRQKLLANLSDNLSEVHVMYHKTELVGLAILQLKGPLTGYIKSIAIAPSWRNKKLGKILIEYVEKRIFRELQNVFLCVSSFNPNAKRFYLNIGYEFIGELKNLVVDGHSELLMRKSIGPMHNFEPEKS